MAANCNKRPQLFTNFNDKLDGWNDTIKLIEESNIASCIYSIINEVSDLSSQLSAVKKIQASLLNTTSFSYIKHAIDLLVEIHCYCASRHPLQRTIASTLTAISKHHSELVKQSIIDCISNLMIISGEETTKEEVTDECERKGEKALLVEEHIFVDYIQSLMEYYPPGERSLHISLPKVIHKFCVLLSTRWRTLCTTSQSINIQDHLLSLTKVLLNILHHCQSLLLQLLKDSQENDVIVTSSKNVIVSLNEIQWPSLSSPPLSSPLSSFPLSSPLSSSPSFTNTSNSGWLRNILVYIKEMTANILIEDKQLTRDLLMSVAMVTIVTMTTLSSSALDTVLPSLCIDWFVGVVYMPLPQLCLIHGLLAKLSISQLISVMIEGATPLVIWLFPKLCDLLEKFTESSDRYVASRTLSLWTNILSTGGVSLVTTTNTTNTTCNNVSPDSTMISRLLEYIWSHWDDPIDGIRQQCKIMFDNLINLYVKLIKTDTQYNIYLQSLSTSLLSLPSPTRGKYSLLTTLVPHLDIIKILTERPHLPQELMSTMGHQSLACRAGELWGVMTPLHYRADNEENWKQMWVVPMVTVLLTGNMLAKEHVKQYCLNSIITTCPGALEIIREVSCDLSRDLSCDSTDVLNVQLICMNYTTSSAVMNDDTSLSVLENAIEHGDDQVVITGVQVICDSTRTTDLPSFNILPLIIKCLHLHFNSQSPWFRQEFLSSLKKLILRITDGTYRVLKEQEKKRLEVTTDIKDMITQYTDFLTQLIQICFNFLSHLFDTFQRRYFALSILHLMSQLLQNPSISQFKFSSLVSDPLAKGLVYILWDTFESNRVLAMNLIRTLNKSKQLFDKESLIFLSQECHKMITSPKYTNCSTGSHLVILLHDIGPDILYDTLSVKSGTFPRGLPLQLGLIECLMDILKDHMIQCGRSLLIGSLNTPMYGVIQAVRSLWEKLSFSSSSSSSSDDQVIQLMERLIDQCITIGHMVSPVVCNSSPEGYLPNERDDSIIKVNKDDDTVYGNSQSVLLCCWHCMKEVVLLMTSLINNQRKLLPQSKIMLISELLIQQLTEARHRGAFEMAYVGFSALCQLMWTSNDPLLYSKPVKWINDLITSLQSGSLTQLLSITRRSAGLPFYCQAIVVTEPKMKDHKCLKELMNVLLIIASNHSIDHFNSSDNTNSSELVPEPSSVHALNIIRGLVRDSRLGEIIVPFIATAIKIAVNGFSAKYWPVRNSCTLLLSALISRVFGVKRVQDERSVKNKMTAREFFTRFPSLHEFLFNALEESLTSVQINGSHNLFPVLLLLSYLYPSPLDETTSPHSLSSFQPLIIKACSSPVWKCRILASHALLPTLTSSTFLSVLSNLFTKLVLSNQNCLHGLLLMISSILVSIGEGTSFSVNEEGIMTIVCGLLDKIHIGKGSINNCPITRGLYLHCITLSLNLLPPSLLKTERLQLSDTLIQLAKECQDELLSLPKIEQVTRQVLYMELPYYQFSFLLSYHDLISSQNLIPPVKIALAIWPISPGTYHNLEEFVYNRLVSSINNGKLTKSEKKGLTLKALSNDSSYNYLLLSAIANDWEKTNTVPINCLRKEDTPTNYTKADTPTNYSKVDTPTNYTKKDTPTNYTNSGTRTNYTKADTPTNYTKADTPTNYTKEDAPTNYDNDYASINWYHYFHATIIKLATQSLREEVKVAIINWCSSVLKYFSSLSSLSLLLDTLFLWCDDTSPVEIRKEIAILLGHNWLYLSMLEYEPYVKTSSDSYSGTDFCSYIGTQSDSCSKTHSYSGTHSCSRTDFKYTVLYWSTVLRLLNDVEESVRISMCTSLQTFIHDNKGSDKFPFVLCQQSCITRLFKAFLLLYDPEVTFTLLINISTDLDATHQESTDRLKHDVISSLLFEEDKTNSFMEPVQLTRQIAEALKGVVSQLGHTHPLVLNLKDTVMSANLSYNNKLTSNYLFNYSISNCNQNIICRCLFS